MSYENGENWEAVASANGVNKRTAYGWIRKGTSEQKKRGGVVANRLKIKKEHEDFLINKLEENCQLTLKELSAKLLNQFGIAVTPQSIGNHLNGRLITVKKIHTQPEAANSIENKRKRKEFVESLMQVSWAHLLQPIYLQYALHMYFRPMEMESLLCTLTKATLTFSLEEELVDHQLVNVR